MSKKSALREQRRLAREARRKKQRNIIIVILAVLILIIAFFTTRQVITRRQQTAQAAATQTMVAVTQAALDATNTAIAQIPPSPTPTPRPMPTPNPNLETVTTSSGLKYQDVIVGSGTEAKSGDTVLVHYTGWLLDGTMFDTSYKTGEPLEFTIGTGSVIKGWEEGIPGMKLGGTRILTIPPELAYGASGSGPIPPNSTLVFEVVLIEVK